MTGRARRQEGQTVKKQLEVVGAVVVRNGEILCAQRGPAGVLPGMWEFPGGKIEVGEAPREALIREIEEELGCLVTVGDEITSTRHEYDFGIVTLTTFYCQLIAGEPEMSEHQALVWLAPSDLNSLEWAPADVPAVKLIQHRFETV
jgi:8-oxo-dGTP diphosphatase